MTRAKLEIVSMKILDVPQSGSLAGQTSSRNRFGQYRRTRAVPVNVNSSAQQATRSNLSSQAIAWRSLSDVQREAWTSYAADHPRTNSLGQTITLTGFQMFVSVNSRLLSLGMDAVTATPSLELVLAPTYSVVSTTVAGFEVDINDALTGFTVGGWASPPVSAGRSFNADFRLVAIVSSPAADAPLITKANYEAKFGTLVAGSKIFIRGQTVDDTGSASAFAPLEVVVT